MARAPTVGFRRPSPPCPALTPAHLAWRDRVRTFVKTHIAPDLAAWDAAGAFPDALYDTAAREGMLGAGFPTALGGHTLQEEFVRPALAGRTRIAFAVTEPAGGSDAAAMTARAERQGGDWRVNGEKALISGALRADYLLPAVRTDGEGNGGLSLLLIDAQTPGVSCRPVPGLSGYSASNGAIEFRDMRVLVSRLIGTENRGFVALLSQFNIERLSSVVGTLAMSRVCLAETIACCRERRTFGQRLIEHQVVRYRLVDLIRQVRAGYAWPDQRLA